MPKKAARLQLDTDVKRSLQEYDISIKLEASDPDLHHYAGLVLEFATEQGYPVRVGLKDEPATYAMAIKRFHDALATRRDLC